MSMFISSIPGVGGCSGILSGGCSSSSTTMKSTLDSINENILNIVSTISNNSSAVCSSDQKLTVSFKRSKFKGCSAVFGNKVDMNCGLMASFTSQNAADIKNIIEQAIDNSASSNNEVVQSFLSTSTSSSQDNIDVKTYIKNLIRKDFNQDISTSCIANLQSTQSQEIPFEDVEWECPPEDPHISWINDAQILSFVKCIGTQVNSIVSNDQLLQSISQEMSVQNKVTQKGIGEAIADVLKEISGPLKYLIIACVVVVLVICVGGVIFLMSPAGQDATKQLSQAGVEKLKKM